MRWVSLLAGAFIDSINNLKLKADLNIIYTSLGLTSNKTHHIIKLIIVAHVPCGGGLDPRLTTLVSKEKNCCEIQRSYNQMV